MTRKAKTDPTELFTAVLTATDKHAKRRDPWDCVLQKQIEDHYPELAVVHVKNRKLSATDTLTGERLTWVIPIEAWKWILAWDAGENPPDYPVSFLRSDAKVITAAQRKARSKAAVENRRIREESGPVLVKPRTHKSRKVNMR